MRIRADFSRCRWFLIRLGLVLAMGILLAMAGQARASSMTTAVLQQAAAAVTKLDNPLGPFGIGGDSSVLPAPTILNLAVNSGSDDADELDLAGTMDVSSSLVEHVSSPGDTRLKNSGFRFTGFEIPQGSTINSCSFQAFEPFFNRKIDVNLHMQRAAAPPSFNGSPSNIKNRPRTGANVRFRDSNSGPRTYTAPDCNGFSFSRRLVLGIRTS